MRSLKMVILPLFVSSVITGTASLDPKSNGRISMISLGYMIGTNCLACVVPILIAVTAKLGKVTDADSGPIGQGETVMMETVDIFADLLRNLFPPNIVSAAFEQSQTKYKTVNIIEYNKTVGLDSLLITNQTRTVKMLGTAPSTNVLGLVLCAFILGMAASAVGASARPFVAFFEGTNAVIIKVVSWLVWSTPLGVASLIAKALLQAAYLDSVVTSLGVYCLTVLGCLLLHLVLVSVIVGVFIMRINPVPRILSLGRPVLVAFATTSTAVAMPETLYALENKIGVDKRITRFVVPLATTINRDGSCIFITVSCIFISQVSGRDMNVGEIIILWTLTTLLSTCIPSVPSASIVMVDILLTSLGYDTKMVGLLFASDWILDRARSSLNSVSHAFCSMLTFHFCKDLLPPLAQDDDQEGEKLMMDGKGSHKDCNEQTESHNSNSVVA